MKNLFSKRVIIIYLAAVLTAGLCTPYQVLAAETGKTPDTAQTATPSGEQNQTAPAAQTVASAGTAAQEAGLYAYFPFGDGRSVNINIVGVGGKNYLFLPSSVSTKGVVVHYNADWEITFDDGTPFPSDTLVDITPHLAAASDDGSRLLSLRLIKNDAQTAYDVCVMTSSAVSGVYIYSDDASKGRNYVESSKSNKASGSLTMISADKSVVYDGKLSQIKCRGNTTFAAEKKPYQIKLDKSTDLVGGGASAKTWLLLANAYDPTLIHNSVGLSMAKKMGLNAPDFKPVDLYYDGSYRGSYLLCEKVQIGFGRVDITDLESSNDDANSGKDLSTHATAMGANKYGDVFQYVTGVKNPADISGGYLLELDTAYYKTERSYFITSAGVPFVVKSPENCSKEEMIFISEYVEEMLTAAANGGTHPETGRSVWDYMDKDSLEKYFIFQEMIRNADSFVSSTYMYLDREKKMVWGPIWDLDDSYGIRPDVSSPEGFCSGAFMEPFMNLSDFRKDVRTYYSSKGYSYATSPGIDGFVKEISASQKMDRILWNGRDVMYTELESYDADIDYMKKYAVSRAKWLKGIFATW